MRLVAVFGFVFLLLSACGSDRGQLDKGEVGDACDSQEACQEHLNCEAGFCVEPTGNETLACGSNSRNFAYEDQAWPTEDFCVRGSLVEESVVFPEPGDEVSWWCQALDSDQGLRCSAERAPAPGEGVDAMCGDNTGLYSHEEEDWPSEEFCLQGQLDDELVPFPGPGEDVSWQCLGLTGGEDVSCSAERALAPVEVVDGLCGENAQDFMREEVGWLSEEFCLQGELQGAMPDFPGPGQDVTWQCLGQEGGDDASCRADRLEVCSPERQEPAGWVRKTARCAYSTSVGWLPSCLAWSDIWPMPFTQVSGVTYRLMVDSDVDNYIALEIDTFGMSDSASGRFNSAPPGSSIGHYRWRILTISRCPGDFHHEAIEEETGCYFTLTGTSPNIAWGGPDTDRACQLEPDEVYYLNIIHTPDSAGTHPDELQSNCDRDICGAVYEMQQD